MLIDGLTKFIWLITFNYFIFHLFSFLTVFFSVVGY
ncbi:MAG: hypothetical protein QOH63_3803 [Acidobacteriota bacterium]|nr:hypothetical protein [Acidobacteriota bacterium]